ncbi:MAG: serine hydrolase [Bacteroidota bacterium]|nr:serine hydrolase [Bacteroidota bacterium]
MKRRVKKALTVVLILVILTNIYIVVTGQFYVYTALWNNYANIDDWKIFNNRKVATANPENLPKHKDYNTETLKSNYIKWLEDYKTVAFLAVRNDSVLHEQYWNNYGPDSASNSFSMAKSVVSILVGIAIDEGKIKSIDEPVSNYISRFKEGARAKLTIKHLLQMSAGFDWVESYVNPFGLTTEAYYGDDLEMLSNKLDVVNEPGKVFNYQSCNQIFLQQILKKATGKNLSEYLSEKLWKPLHANRDASWSTDKANGNEKAFCCINSNARDFARIGMLFLHQGKWKGQQVVSKEWVAQSINPAAIIDEHGKPCDFYGYSWWLTKIPYKGTEHQVYYMRGVLGQFTIVIPDYELVIVRLGEIRSSKSIGEHRPDIYQYMNSILEAYCQ